MTGLTPQPRPSSGCFRSVVLWAALVATTGACSAPPAPAEPELRSEPAPPAAPDKVVAEAIAFPRESWQAAGIVITPAAIGPLEESATL
ncbi:MAG: hypothetical protein EBX36_09620, partial [Planctomycetia bacterium]|nr:hypothetical protein [Planctomycetia bacterium]